MARITAARRREFIQHALPAWFRRVRRELPWRGREDPYAIWVSEVMLQQTRAATVARYFEPFLERFPDAATLAAASLDDVLKAWEGMGYYGRARNLHRAAGVVVERFGGRLPSDPAELRRLPGVGAYTAGAVASIAFGLDEPVLDGNVTRVLCRVHLIRRPPAEPQIQRRLWRLARKLTPPGQAARMNQALMDLGATVCLPRGPACGQCPIEGVCRARAAGAEERLPARAPRRPTPHQTVAVGIVRRGGRILIGRRRPEGLLGGLWELPGGKRAGREPLAETARREIREETGVDVRLAGQLVVVRHAYTHFRVTIHAFLCDYVAGRARPIECDAVRWVRPAELADYAFPTATRKIIAAWREATGAAAAGESPSS
jgi:A/G-specific adenine glycosylase